jgi:hypothetical protein
MGHERVGYLPKTQRWKSIVEKINQFSSTNDNVSDIALETIKNVRNRFQNIEQDTGVISAFKYLVLLAHASRLSEPDSYLKTKGISLSKEFNIFELTKSVQDYVLKNQSSKEYSTFAVQSMIDTISDWSRKNEIQQSLIFDSNKNSFDTWQKAADGKGFCELSRTFFSKFTERYLKYFLEREASSKIKSLYDRQQFINKLENHVQDISQHAFETAKIIQSLSAGWFNNKARTAAPRDAEVKGFLSYAFKKINSELVREENND